MVATVLVVIGFDNGLAHVSGKNLCFAVQEEKERLVIMSIMQREMFFVHVLCFERFHFHVV